MSKSRSSRPRATRLWRVAMAAATTVLAVGTPGGIAHAHTEFDHSVPADGDVVDGPVSEVEIAFTNPATPAGSGFEVLDAGGVFVTPTSVDQTDGTAFVLSFEPPLEDGTFGVRWEVQAGDAHPISGSFAFTVRSATTTTTDLQQTSPTSPPSSDTDLLPATAATATTTTIPTTTTLPTTSASTTVPSFEEFLATDGDGGGSGRVAWVGRFLSSTGLVVGLGSVVALIWVLSGRKEEFRSILNGVRLAGLVVATGGVLELAALDAVQQSDLGELLTTKAGVAAVLKVVGGLAVFFGTREDSGRVLVAQHPLSAAVAHRSEAAVSEHVGGNRWMPTTADVVLFAGFATVLVSFWFDGHTVTRGPWAVHALSNLVHLVAAAAWAGGLICIARLVWQRHRDGRPSGAAELVMRFSSVAALALVGVVGAGALMAVFTLDTPGDLTSTEWGRTLLIKSAAVAVAAAIGAYNHFRLRPALESAPDSPGLATEFRRSLLVEAGVFVVVLAATAWLVGAAT